MHRGIVVLDAPVVPAAEQRAVGREERGADRNPAFGAPGARLLERDGEHLRVVVHVRQGFSSRRRTKVDTMIGAIILGFAAGIIGRMLMPGDVFRDMSGATSWLVSLGLGLAGAALGWLIFTGLLGIGDDDVFDLGGILSAIIGVLILLPIAGWVLRRSGKSPERPRTPRG